MKSVSYAMLLVGTIIGAGFASGREIRSFFGSGHIPIYIAPLVAVLIFLCSSLLLFVGKQANEASISGVNQKVMGKAHVFADSFLLFNSLTVLAGMLAAIDSLFSLVLPIAPAYSIISGILCALIVLKGLKGLIGGNSIIVPVITTTIVLICCFAIESPVFSFSFNSFGIVASVIYVSMNMMLASTVFTTINTMNKKDIFVSSAVASAIIGTLMLLIILALNSTGNNGAMPLMEIAQSKNKMLFYVALAAIAVSIFTTMMMAMAGLYNWLKTLLGDGKCTVAIDLVAGLLVSNLGFENVIGYLYPVIGFFGLLYILTLTKYAFCKKSCGLVVAGK